MSSIFNDQMRERLGNAVCSFNEPVIKNFHKHVDELTKLLNDSAEIQSTVNQLIEAYVKENIIAEDRVFLAKLLLEGGVKIGAYTMLLHVLSNQDLFAQKALNKAFNKINEILVKRQKPINVLN